MQKKKEKLNTSVNSQFKVFGIASHNKPFSVSWELNRLFDLNFKVIDPLSIFSKSHQREMSFTLYSSLNSDNSNIYLIENLSQDGIFLESAKIFNYLLILSELPDNMTTIQLNSKLRSSEMILISSEVEIKTKMELDILSLLNL